MLKHMLDKHEEEDMKDVKWGMFILEYKRSAFERQISEAVKIQEESSNRNILNSKAEWNQSSLPRLVTRMGNEDEEFKKLEKERQIEKKKDEEFETKLRQLKKNRNKTRLLKETNSQPRKKLKLDENNAYISIRNSWDQQKPTAPKKHLIEHQETDVQKTNKKQRTGERLTNIKTLENIVIEGETITEFEILEVNWEEHLENHRIYLEEEARIRNERLNKKEIKEKSWELYKRCQNFLEENDKDWERRRNEREIEKKKQERLSLANTKQERIRQKVKEIKLEEDIKKDLAKLPPKRRNEIEQEEERKRKQDLIETKKSLWKLRGKEKIKVQRKPDNIEKFEKLECMKEKLTVINKILSEIEEEDRKKKEAENEKKKNKIKEWRKKLQKKEEKEETKRRTLELQRKVSERWAMQKWVTKFIADHSDIWEKERIDKEKEVNKELEEWEKYKRFEKIKHLRQRWTSNPDPEKIKSAEVISDTFLEISDQVLTDAISERDDPAVSSTNSDVPAETDGQEHFPDDDVFQGIADKILADAISEHDVYTNAKYSRRSHKQ